MKDAGLQISRDIFVGYSISTQQYFIDDPLGKRLHRSRDVVFRDGKRNPAQHGAGKAMLNEHFYRDVIEEPKPYHTPIEKQPTECQREQPFDNDSALDPPKPKKK
jgi:hypothetical protein